jgi:hypothetical protein
VTSARPESASQSYAISCGAYRRSCSHGWQLTVEYLPSSDRLRAVEPQRRDQLSDPNRRQPRIVAQQPMDLVLERIELRRPLGTAKRRRRRGAQRLAHGLPRQTGPLGQRPDRNPPNEVLPSQLSPALHLQHPFLPVRTSRTGLGSPPPRTTRVGQLNRWRWVRSQALPTSLKASQLAARSVTLPITSDVTDTANRNSKPLREERRWSLIDPALDRMACRPERRGCPASV